MAFAAVEMGSLGKEVTHPSFPKVKVKTKVKTSKFQIPVSSRKGTSFIAISLVEKYMFVLHTRHTQRKINESTSFAIDNMYYVNFRI